MRGLRSITFCAAIALAALSSPSMTRAQTDPAVAQFVAFLDHALHAIYAKAKTDDGALRAGCRDLMLQVLDLEAMGRSALGPAWDPMTAEQRKAYLPAFERRILRDCVGPIRDYTGDPVVLIGMRPSDRGERLVAVRFGPADDPSRVITWRLRGEGVDGVKVIDIIVDGRSTAVNLRNEFAAVLKARGMDGLIEFLSK